MKDYFLERKKEIEDLKDKEKALFQIKSKEWPLSKKPKWFNKDQKKTMEIIHYIKFYLQHLLTL